MLLRAVRLGIIQGFLLCWVSQAQPVALRICLEDHAGLNPPARAAFHQELTLLLTGHGIHLDWSPCPSNAASIVRLAVHDRAPRSPEGVLGRATMAHGSVTPQLEVFLDPVRSHLPNSQCWSVIGRALARVAAHEVAHFALQRPGHDDHGVLKASFSGSDLSSDDSLPFSLGYARSAGD